jgi:hypothetical protein
MEETTRPSLPKMRFVLGQTAFSLGTVDAAKNVARMAKIVLRNDPRKSVNLGTNTEVPTRRIVCPAAHVVKPTQVTWRSR